MQEATAEWRLQEEENPQVMDLDLVSVHKHAKKKNFTRSLDVPAETGFKKGFHK